MLIEEDDYLAHYGVMGMKWGVRHDRPKGGRVKKFLSSTGHTLKRFGRVTSENVNKAKKAYDLSKAKSLEKKLAKDRYKASQKEMKLLRSKDTRKARQVALTTHDPRVLAKYQHLLTDKELTSRYNRLDLENKVSNMATKRSDRGFEVFKKRADWAMNSPAGKAAIDIGSAWAKKQLGVNGKAEDVIKKATGTSKASSQNDPYYWYKYTRTAGQAGKKKSTSNAYAKTSNAYAETSKNYNRSRYSQIRGLPSGG